MTSLFSGQFRLFDPSPVGQIIPNSLELGTGSCGGGVGPADTATGATGATAACAGAGCTGAGAASCRFGGFGGSPLGIQQFAVESRHQKAKSSLIARRYLR